MKKSSFLKFLFIGFFLTVFVNSCSIGDDNSSKKFDFFKDDKNQIVFHKSPNLSWGNRRVEVSFEDNLDQFYKMDIVSQEGIRVGYALSENNLKQGITIKLKITEVDKIESISEIMIEPYELEKGKNDFTIGYIENKPYIIN